MTSPEEFRIQSTSAQSAKGSSIVISENSSFQKIIIPEVVRLSKESPPQLKISIVTRRKTATQEWEKIEEPSSIQLKAQESKSLNLTSEETNSLFDALKKRFTNLLKMKGLFTERKILLYFL